MKTLSAMFGFLALCGAAAVQAAGGDPDAGMAKSAVCMGCHGADGNSPSPEWPNLAGQGADYIAAQVALFRQGVRDNALMMPMAALLSEQDALDVGAHYARQAPAPREADPALAPAGERLYRGGDPARGLPACIACHGPQGLGNAPARYPALRAQHSVYAYNQLKAYAAGTRRTPGNDIMQVIAAKLTEDEMRALASYTQGLR